MKNKPYIILIIAISMLGILVAQDPPPLPDADQASLIVPPAPPP